MARKKSLTTMKILAEKLFSSVVTFAKKENLDKEEVLKFVFGDNRLYGDCRDFEKFEKVNKEYIVIPVILKRKNTDTIKKLLELNSQNLKNYLEEMKRELSEEATEIEELIENFCPVGECEEEVEVPRTEVNEEKPKRRRGRPPKKKEKVEIDDLVEEITPIPKRTSRTKIQLSDETFPDDNDNDDEFGEEGEDLV